MKLSRQDSFGTPVGVRLSFLYPSPMRGPACHILARARSSVRGRIPCTAVACPKKTSPPGDKRNSLSPSFSVLGRKKRASRQKAHGAGRAEIAVHMTTMRPKAGSHTVHRSSKTVNDTRDGEPPRQQQRPTCKFKIGTWPAAGAARCKRSPLQARGCGVGTPTTDT